MKYIFLGGYEETPIEGNIPIRALDFSFIGNVYWDLSRRKQQAERHSLP